jgi:hypothetical protein
MQHRSREIDGGPGAEPKPKVAVWLVTDQRGELIREIRKLARPRGLEPVVSSHSSNSVSIEPHNVVHTSHDTYGYVIPLFGEDGAVFKIVVNPV